MTEDAASSDLVRRYFAIAFRLGRLLASRGHHFFVDRYTGPADWRPGPEDASAEPDPAALSDACLDLQRDLQSSGPADPRWRFLHEQVAAINALCVSLSGREIPFADLVRQVVGGEPVVPSPEQLERGRALLDRALPGRDPLTVRIEAWRTRNRLPPGQGDLLRELVQVTIDEARRRTHALVELPPGEALEVVLVRNRPYGAASWYLGDARSRIEFNVDRPLMLFSLPTLVFHETYPGHHAETVVKEQTLARRLGWLEHSMLLAPSPQATIAEGLATLAFETVMSPAEAAEWARSEIYARAEVDVDDVDLAALFEAATCLIPDEIAAVAAVKLAQGASPEEAARVFTDTGMATATEAGAWVADLAVPVRQVYAFTYSVGRAKLRPLVAAGGRREYARLLRGALTPSLRLEVESSATH